MIFMFQPSFVISNKILTAIAKIEAAEEVIRHAPILPLWEKQFREDAVVRAAYHGTHLEGNLLAKEEAKEVLEGRDVVARPRDIQEVINYRKVIEYIEEEAKKQFGFLMEAFEFGAPPHGGIAFGFDRLCSLFGGADSIRDFIAFPKNNSGRDMMIDTPSTISNEQLNELQIAVQEKKK
jgi:hypothetical protein